MYLLKEDGDQLLKEDGGGILLDRVPPVMWIPVVTPGTLADVLLGPHTPVARLTFLDDDLVTALYTVSSTETDNDDRRLLDGSVSGDRARDSHLSGSVSVAGEAFLPRAASSLVWPERPVLLERGAIVGQTPIYEPLMLGLIEDPTESEGDLRINFAVRDRLTLLSKPFPEAVTFPTGMRGRDLVRSVFELGGFGTSDALYHLDDNGITLVAPQTYDWSDMLVAVIRFAFDIGCDLWDEHDGAHMEPFVDPSTREPAWKFAPGRASVLTSLTVTRRAQAAYNRQLVGGTGVDGYPIWGEAKVTNPADPLFWTEDNDRPAQVEVITGIVATQQMVNAVAWRLLIQRSYYFEEVIAEVAPIPLVKDRRVVHFAGAGVNDRYLVDTFNINLGLGTMRLSSRKARSLSA